jgi:cytochrome oxidase Cu insertion factor (SCO1/SenC/PrrC family)
VTRRTLRAFALTSTLLAAAAPAFAAEEERGPALGAEAPGFTLQALDGREVSLAGLTGEGPVVLVFFRGAW